MGNNVIYVGKLVPGTTIEELEELFNEYSVVKIITKREKNFAFVELASPEEVEQAIKELNGAEFKGKNIKLDKARPSVKKDKE
jgi:RNA recognition motif-containing protein